MSSPPEPTDEELARLLVRVLAAMIVLLLAGGVASVAGRLGDEPDTAAVDEDPVLALGGRDAIGPLPGTAVVPYLAQRGNALAEARGRHAAVVSFTDYLSTADLQRVLGKTRPERLLVAMPGGRSIEAAPGEDLDALVTAQREEASREKAALEQLLPSVEDPDFARQYQQDIALLGALLERKAERGAPLVFAVVVVESADRLRQFARNDSVRIVDIGAGTAVPAGGAVAGLRPDETVRAGEPPSRPL